MGIAAIASTASRISKLLTDRIKESLKTAEATHYSKTGTMFILGLIASHPHSWLGSYWRTKGGETESLYCKEGIAKAKEVLSVEVPASLADLATSLFGSSQVNTVAANKRLKVYFDNAWESLSYLTATAHRVAAIWRVLV